MITPQVDIVLFPMFDDGYIDDKIMRHHFDATRHNSSRSVPSFELRRLENILQLTTFILNKCSINQSTDVHEHIIIESIQCKTQQLVNRVLELWLLSFVLDVVQHVADGVQYIRILGHIAYLKRHVDYYHYYLAVMCK